MSEEINQVPAKEKRRKSPSLLKSTREAIAKYKAENPKMTLVEIAQKFSVKENQVRRAINQAADGTLERKRYRQPFAKIRATMEEKNAEEIIEHQYHYSAASLQHALHLAPDERIGALQKLVATKGLIARQKLASHLKNADADFVAFLYRKFVRPDLTDDQVVTHYYEDYERWKRALTQE